MKHAVVLVLLASCDQIYGLRGRIDDARLESDAVAVADAGIDDAMCSGPLVLDTDNIIPMTEFSGAKTQPCRSRSGLELFFTASNPPSGLDLFRATRASVTAPWSMGIPETFNSEYDDEDASITGDGLRLFFTSNRESQSAARAVYEVRREGVGAEWSNVDKIAGISFEPQSIDVSPDGKTLYLVDRGGVNGLYRMERASVDASWTSPVMVGIGTMSPSVDASDQVMYWADNVGIRRAVRSGSAFIGADVLVPDAADPDLSPDGNTLTFSTAGGLAYVQTACPD